MSHVADLNLQILDLDALKAAVKAEGCEFSEGQTHHNWYERYVDDSRLTDRDPATFGKCLHAIKIPGVKYEIGVIRHKSGKGYDLAFDNFGSSRGIHDGQLIEQRFGGESLPALRQAYSKQLGIRELARKGYRLVETRRPDGTIVVKGIK